MLTVERTVFEEILEKVVVEFRSTSESTMYRIIVAVSLMKDSKIYL